MQLVTKTSDKEIVRKYLSSTWKEGGYYIISSYFAALRHARKLSGRSLKNGKIINTSKLGSWPAVCMYLILIDHMGDFFIKRKSSTTTNIYITCLKKLGNLKEKEAKTIFALRNSFLHKFHLYNVRNRDKEKFIFRVNIDPYSLIKFPSNTWYGDFSIQVDDTYATIVSLKKLGDLVEKMHQTLLNLLKSNKFYINLPKNTSVEQFLDFNTVTFK